ncbi:hypothetical protein ACFL6C_11810 [Myxococcota bacterium]
MYRFVIAILLPALLVQGCASTNQRGDLAASGAVQTGLGGAIAWSGVGGLVGGSISLAAIEGDESSTYALVLIGLGVAFLAGGTGLLVNGASSISMAVSDTAEDDLVHETPEHVITVPTICPGCNACPTDCAAHQDECNQGSVPACYRAGACMCQCKLDAGGCGEPLERLRECVAKNVEKAGVAPTPTPAPAEVEPEPPPEPAVETPESAAKD